MFLKISTAPYVRLLGMSLGFFTLKPISVSDYCCLIPKFEQELDRT